MVNRITPGCWPVVALIGTAVPGRPVSPPSSLSSSSDKHQQVAAFTKLNVTNAEIATAGQLSHIMGQLYDGLPSTR